MREMQRTGVIEDGDDTVIVEDDDDTGLFDPRGPPPPYPPRGPPPPYPGPPNDPRGPPPPYPGLGEEFVGHWADRHAWPLNEEFVGHWADRDIDNLVDVEGDFHFPSLASSPRSTSPSLTSEQRDEIEAAMARAYTHPAYMRPLEFPPTTPMAETVADAQARWAARRLESEMASPDGNQTPFRLRLPTVASSSSTTTSPLLVNEQFLTAQRHSGVESTIPGQVRNRRSLGTDYGGGRSRSRMLLAQTDLD